MRKIILTMLTIFYFLHSEAQTEKMSIAILPFVNSGDEKTNGANLIQEMVTKEFVKTGRFDIVDRTKFQKVMDELKVQKNEEFLNGKIVDQGKQLGAEYLITGIVTQMNTQSEVISNNFPGNANRTNTTVYKHNIKFSYQVIDVASGKAVYTENISSVNTGSHNVNRSDAIDNSECLLRKSIRKAVMKQFPEEIQIINIEKKTKKGLPDEVLISAGSNFFDADSKDECSKGLDKINPFKKKESVKLKVYQIETYSVNGKELKREKELGMLKLKDVQGETSVCEVTDGAKEIQEKLDGNQKIFIKIL